MADDAVILTPSAVDGPTKADTTAHDDRVRKWLAVLVIVQFVIVAGSICAFLVHADSAAKPVTNGVLSVLIMVVQSEIAFVMLALQYYFGSSSGSTAKSVAMEKKP